jgi:hypothetical protein
VADGSDAKTRGKIALWVILLGIAGIVLCAGLAIGLATSGSRPEITRLVFTSALPLFGTWVGTVIAFYFAQAATESTLRLTGRAVDPTALVGQVMIPKQQIVSLELSDSDLHEIPLSKIREKMTSSGKYRIPILNSAGAVQYVVHESTLTAYELSSADEPAEPARTVADLVSAPAFRNILKAIGFVGQNATVAEARKKMGSIKGCNDVFVTATGEETEPIIGWLTNTDLASK